QQIVDRILALGDGTRFQVLAPVVRGRKGEYSTLFSDLASQGYVRARVDGEVVDLAEAESLERYVQHTIEVVVDRLVIRDGIEQRLTESVEAALGLADGHVHIHIVPKDTKAKEQVLTYSRHLYSPESGRSFEDPAPRNFSFNSPYGACLTCDGLGTRFEVDPDLIVPDGDLSIVEGAIAPWASSTSQYYPTMLKAASEAFGVPLDKPWKKLTQKQRDLLMGGGGGKKITVSYKNRYGRKRSYESIFEGAVPFLERRHADTDSDWARDKIEGYMRQVACSACGGARLNPVSLAVLIDGRTIHELCELSIGEACKAIAQLKISERNQIIADPIVKEISERLNFLLDVGLDYLSLNRSAGTLAGGEAQRIRLASQIGSGLVGVLYVLDEPSIGLHQRDNARLIETLLRLKRLGNTVLVVEHDEETIRVADYVVDIGPGAGEHGGHLVYAGDVKGLLKSKDSVTGQYLAGKKSIPVPLMRRS
ncbi:MAG: excinuclease ABC subunit UvrA, partial [Acidimicrobiales bacterium]